MIPACLIHKRFTRFFLSFIAAAMFFMIGPPSSVSADEESNVACYRTLAEEALVCRPQICPGNLYAGGSVSFRLAPGHGETKFTGPSLSWVTITIMDREFPVVVLPDSFYTGYRRLTLGPTDYWVITEYTGGMRGCDRFHVFSRPAPGKSVIYLGTTTGGAGGLPGQILSCRNGALYLEDQDVRFAYFHTPYAESQLLFPRYYQITPFTLSVDNRSFRDQYLQLARETEKEIRKTLEDRSIHPTSILTGSGIDSFFSDLLGQLLVRRTILYLYAGEETAAWTTLAKDIKEHYLKDQSLAQLQAEITQILAASPH